MNQVASPSLPKSKEAALNREIDDLLATMKQNIQAIKNSNKQIDKLRTTNDRSFERMKRAIEGLRNY